jgi:hypothetical protein
MWGERERASHYSYAKNTTYIERREKAGIMSALERIHKSNPNSYFLERVRQRGVPRMDLSL